MRNPGLLRNPCWETDPVAKLTIVGIESVRIGLSDGGPADANLWPRFTVRRLMVAVAILGLLLGLGRWLVVMRTRSAAYQKIAFQFALYPGHLGHNWHVKTSDGRLIHYHEDENSGSNMRGAPGWPINTGSSRSAPGWRPGRTRRVPSRSPTPGPPRTARRS